MVDGIQQTNLQKHDGHSCCKSPYDFQIVHCVGTVNQNVDGLNQNPFTSQHDNMKLGGMERLMRKRYQDGMPQLSYISKQWKLL
jgi:hypothetical protein